MSNLCRYKKVEKQRTTVNTEKALESRMYSDLKDFLLSSIVKNRNIRLYKEVSKTGIVATAVPYIFVM